MGQLPKYYFGDIPADVAQEIMDHWLNCHNVAATLPDWYDRVAEFKAALC